MQRWKKITSIEITLNLSGAALAKKGYPGHFQPTCTIDTKATKVVIQGLGNSDPDDRWIYTPERVWIESEDGTIKASRDNPYEAFADHTANSSWDDLHLLTFGGYAFHNYLTFPFHLRWPGFQSREVDPHQENGETWRVLEVSFPDSYPAHSRIQWFYFDKNFMLRRLDYAPLAFKIPAAHYCFDHKEFNGIKIPMLRRVVLRKPDAPMKDGIQALGGWTYLGGPTSFLLDYCRVVVRQRREESIM